MAYNGGISARAGLPELAVALKKISPKKIYDVGAGKGWNGPYLRDIYPDAQIISLDIWEPSIQQCRDRKCYDDCRCLDVIPWLDDQQNVAENYSESVMWFIGDVLEHMPRDVAFRILRSTAPQYITVRIPVGPCPQKGCKENPFEAHLWTFYPNDLKEATNLRRLYTGIANYRDKDTPVIEDEIDRVCYRKHKAHTGQFILENINHPLTRNPQ